MTVLYLDQKGKELERIENADARYLSMANGKRVRIAGKWYVVDRVEHVDDELRGHVSSIRVNNDPLVGS